GGGAKRVTSSLSQVPCQELLARAAAEAGAGRIDDAIATYRSVLEMSPTLAEAHHNCGALLFARGDFDAAARSFDKAARHKPAWLAPLLALGHVHFHSGHYGDAQRAFERALALDANSIEALGNLGLTLQRRSRWSAALTHLQRARALAPTDARVWFALRTSLLLLGRIEEAVEDFLRFEPGAPLSAELVTTGLMFSRFLGDPAYEAKYLPLALDWPYRPDQADLAAVTVSRAQYCDLPRERLLELYRKYDRLQQQNRSRFEPVALTRRAAVSSSGRMRIGYLSADFRAHVMGRLMREVLAAHDPARVSLYLYSLAPEVNEDQLTGEFRGLCERFVNLAERDDHSAARAIAGDEIDVLVDLMGHSSFSRPGILLWKPAPVIITHLGYHGCVGLSQIDFKLTDAVADLPDAASFQIEAPLALDCCVLPVRRVGPVSVPASAPAARRAELGIADSEIVFGAFVSLLKLSPRCLTLWRDILQRVPRSLLAFSPGNASEQSLYRRRVAGFGIDPARVVFIPRAADEAGDRARYELIDVVLDTVPYTGGDTSAAALDMGVPVVTRAGERHAERMSLSLLSHLGVTDTVAHGDAEYVAIACRLADDAAWRLEVAAKIVDRFRRSDIADTRRYAACLEEAYARALAIKSGAAA
ncbi:MAG TPA: tetratricopeptide repeat protein, partial [Casimicrobiaceae bacterium]|nr:tetratricopeptide repeat protein [Casimicrobiaceae bacterium]